MKEWLKHRINWLKAKIKNLNKLSTSLRYKILAFFICFTLITTGTLYLIYSIYMQYITQRVELTTYETVKQTNKNIDSKLNLYNKLTRQIYANKEVIMGLEELPEDTYNRSEINESLSETFNGLINIDKYVSSVYLFAANGNKYIYGTDFYNMEIDFSKYQNKAKEGNGRVVWLSTKSVGSSPSYLMFSAVRQLRSRDAKEIGTMVLLIKEDFFKDIFKDVNFGENAKNIIIADDLTVVSSTNNGEIGQMNSSSYVRKAISIKQGAIITEVDNRRQMVVFATSEITGWTFITMIPIDSLFKEIYKIKSIIIFIVIIFIMCALLISYFFSKRVTHPIKKLSLAIGKIEEGCFSISLDNQNKDEIGEFSRSFEQMAKKVEELLNEVKEKEQLKSQAELAALQSQISPHFIYNTLNSIKWMAILTKQDNIKNMISSLIDMLKSAADSNQELNTIKDELEVLKSYTYIQSVRFSNFKMFYEVQEDIMENKIMKFLLQPIVENSIIHGIASIERVGLISVSIARQEDNLCIIISDNGTGISTQTEQNLIASNEKKYNKIGLANVHNRIVLKYGEAYGLRIESDLGKGTDVTVLLPIIP